MDILLELTKTLECGPLTCDDLCLVDIITQFGKLDAFIQPNILNKVIWLKYIYCNTKKSDIHIHKFVSDIS